MFTPKKTSFALLIIIAASLWLTAGAQELTQPLIFSTFDQFFNPNTVYFGGVPAEDGWIVQVICDGAEDGIDPPIMTGPDIGMPSDDDFLADPVQNIINSFVFNGMMMFFIPGNFLTMNACVCRGLGFGTEPVVNVGDIIYLRAFNSTDWSTATYYADMTETYQTILIMPYMPYTIFDIQFDPELPLGGTPPNLALTLTPSNPPIVIPDSGGSFDYNIALENISLQPETIDFWTIITLPAGGEMEVLNIPDFTIPANTTIDRDRTQNIPGRAPAGTYTYSAYVGTYPSVVIEEDSFTFEKEGTDGGEYLASETDWLCTGESFTGEAITSILPKTCILYSPYPNPFNPETTLRFYLSEPSDVSLIIYDIQGREVARLIDSFHSAGIYETTWNAAGLPSSVYFARLTAGKLEQSHKLLLVK
ncbi:MAG: T9SS type A sorting domain-containing protein [candidate division Zixibacteria bacterium]|nr:T9SS type A sorting domain-containing protein [Candidatus Tariuqbacter arcticus]